MHRPRLLAAALAALLLPACAATAPAPDPGVVAAVEGRLDSGTAVLLSRRRHDDYEKATFSFRHGLRDDPDREVHNNWDLEFGNGGDFFSVLMVTDDRSGILDLGEGRLDDPRNPPAFPPYAGRENARVPAVEGHVYAVHTLDGNGEGWSLFRVAELVPEDSCAIEWVHWTPAPPRKDRGPDPLADPAARARVAAFLDGTRARAAEERRARMGLLDGTVEILLQAATGAQGGNRSTLRMDGVVHRLPDVMAGEELDLAKPPTIRDEARWFARTGCVPEGRVLLVESADLFAAAPGDSNGHGEVSLLIGTDRLFQVEEEAGPFQVWFEGRALVPAGEEGRVALSLANSSAAEVRLRGRLVTAAEAADLAPVPFVPATAPAGVPRAGGRREGTRSFALASPRVVLQVRTGAGGGNPVRVSMLGRGSIYLDRMSNEPLSLEAPPSMREDAVGFTDGGRIPRGRVFVVTRASWEGTAAGDSNGHGEFVVKIGREELVKVRDSKESLRGSWTGRVEVRPGEEAGVYLQVANSCTGTVVIEGEFREE